MRKILYPASLNGTNLDGEMFSPNLCLTPSDLDSEGMVRQGRDVFIARMIWRVSTTTGNTITLTDDIIGSLQALNVKIGPEDLCRLVGSVAIRLDTNTDAVSTDSIQIMSFVALGSYYEYMIENAGQSNVGAGDRIRYIIMFDEIVRAIGFDFLSWAAAETHGALISIDFYLYSGAGVEGALEASS